MIKTQGGASVYSVSEKSSHLVTSQEGYNEQSAKVVAAKNLGIHVVSKEFVVDSITHGAKQDEKQYYFTVTAPPTTPTIAASPVFIPSPTSIPTQASPITQTSPTGLTITVPQQRSPYSPVNPSPNSPPPGFSNLRAPQNLSPTGKKGFGLRVDVPNKSDDQRQYPNPSPKYPTPKYSPKHSPSGGPRLDINKSEDEEEDYSSDDDSGGRSPQSRAWESATPQYLEDDGCKIFVGGIMFDDLEALKKTKDGYTVSAEVIAHIQKLKNERLLEIIRIFSRFGTVVRVKQFLEKRHIFITYDNKSSALQALRTLKPLEVRKKIVQEIRERLRAEDRQTIVSPRSNFYVRWPHHVDSEDGYSPRSYFSGSSAPSSPTSGVPTPTYTQRLSWGRQPQSPTTNVAFQQQNQRSYFTNNFGSNNSVVRATSMRSYFSQSESEQEGSNNANSFSENEAPFARPPRYQPPAVRHNSDITPSTGPIIIAHTGTAPPTHLSGGESDSDTPSGIRHRSARKTAPGVSSTQSGNAAPSLTTSLAPSLVTPSSAPIVSPASTASYSRERRRAANDEGAWHKVIILVLVLIAMGFLYFYNNKT